MAASALGDALRLTVGHGSTVQLLDIHVDTPKRGSSHRLRENQTARITANNAISLQPMMFASIEPDMAVSGVFRRKTPCLFVTWSAFR